MKIRLWQFEYSFDEKAAQIVLPVLLLVLALTGCERSYDDCILTNMHGVTSDVAAAAIRRSCRPKFPETAETKPGQRELDSSEFEVLTGRAGLMYGNTYGGNLYNGNAGQRFHVSKRVVSEFTPCPCLRDATPENVV